MFGQRPSVLVLAAGPRLPPLLRSLTTMAALSAPKLLLLSLLATLVGTVNAFDDIDDFGFSYSNPSPGNRPNLNTKPKPAIPIISAPAGFAVQRADGRQLPPYDTLYEFNQVGPLQCQDR